MNQIKVHPYKVRFQVRNTIMKKWDGGTMGKSPRDSLIVFTPYSEPGKTKTRLIPALGEEGAAELQRTMTLHTLAIAEDLARRRPTSVEVLKVGTSVSCGRCSERTVAMSTNPKKISAGACSANVWAWRFSQRKP